MKTASNAIRSAIVLVVAVVLTFVLIEGATLLLGHELTWFGGLSTGEAAAVRYGLLLLSVVVVVAAVLRRRRDQ